MVVCAAEHGIRETARLFNTTRHTVRKWYRRYQLQGYEGLLDRSRRPHCSPRAIAALERQRIVELKTRYKRLGAEAIRSIEGLPYCAKTIRTIWRCEGHPARRPRRKHRTKRNLREVKRQWALFERILEDTKYLCDIPEYWSQMKALDLPRFQYTARDVTSGLLYLGFAQERSVTLTARFAHYLSQELQRRGADLSQTTRQTDNGSEYIGAWNAKEESAYTRAIERTAGQIHETIPPRAHRYQADVETVHNLIELEFFEIERFTDRQDFINKAHAYQLFFNLARPNSYKENQTPWEIAKSKQPALSPRIAMIPPILIDDHLMRELEKYPLVGHHVLTVP
jgi:transposase